MNDDEMLELERLMKRVVKLLPKLRAPLNECDEKWADMVEECVLRDLLGDRRLSRLRGHITADALAWQDLLGPAIKRQRKA